ncbi:MAG: imidazole glycerol phosphate synthase subunit HisH, partial [Propionibacteriaceae bacterium]|nr:imidazole glycerol phosphate synthase subunit HisH [Propionibacteriaceae bacterium]
LTAGKRECLEADGLAVPGVGAFAACVAQLLAVGGDEIIHTRLAAGKPVFGICVGHQVMFERGVEHGVEAAGLGVLPGSVERLDAAVLPHMGWNTVRPPAGSQLFAGAEAERFYFVHSYGVRALDRGRVAYTEYGGGEFVSAVEDGPLWCTQFHPEKSGAAGAILLRNWLATL